MDKARSIKQNALHDALPDFRSLGVMLRILLVSNGMALLLALLQAGGWADVLAQLMRIATLFVPVLLVCLLLLWVAQPRLNRLSYRQGVLAVSVLVATMTLATYYAGGELYRTSEHGSAWFEALRYALIGVLVSSVLLMYFRWRSQVLSRALHEAHLQVLRARIRPHFLFNSINAVLSIVRTRPREAEAALEDMSDLFRMAMSDARDLVPLRQELGLCRQYIALEQLRMGGRLRVDWQVKDVGDDALIPPLLLQPLLENAVYHGIEPLPQGGDIVVTLWRNGDELRLRVENPCAPGSVAPHDGNRMALQNIRERLALLFDVEARYKVESGTDFYRVEIALPYLKEETA